MVVSKINAPVFNECFSVDLLGWMKLRRLEDRKLVFTNGCYDLLHSGHISLLSWIKETWPGSLTLVAVNSDDSVRRLKGAGRPLNSLIDRAVVLSAMRQVDAVCAFAEDTPSEIVKFVHPDILVKGGDYRDRKIVGEDFVLGYGGIVRKGPYMPGMSTTELIKTVASHSQSCTSHVV